MKKTKVGFGMCRLLFGVASSCCCGYSSIFAFLVFSHDFSDIAGFMGASASAIHF